MNKETQVFNYDTKKGSRQVNNSWWTSDKASIAADAYAVLKAIRMNQVYRERENLKHARLYCNQDLQQFIVPTNQAYFGQRLTFNIARTCVNTICAKIGKGRPRPQFLTSKGDYSQQKRAKKLTQFIDGVFYDTKVHNKGQQAFRDACIFGTGAVKVVIQNDKVTYEKAFINEITVDDLDGRDMSPRSLHQSKILHREVVLSAFGSNKDARRAIEMAEEVPHQKITKVSDLIEVHESWHLPSAPDATDGRRIIYTSAGTLLDEPYVHDFFPFAFLRWSPPVLGFFGEGLVSELVPIQISMIKALQTIEESQELMSVPRILVEENSNVSSAKITDEIGGIIRYRNTKPEFFVPTAQNREMYDWVEYLYRKGFETTGVSQLSASSKKPSGLDSGVALREYQDIETDRFSLIASAYQEFYMDLARLTIEAQRELSQTKKKLSVNVKGRKFMETIKWSEVDLEDDKFIMQAFPSNMLPKTPEGRLQFTQELIQSGFISQEEGLSLLDFPDLEQFFNLRTSSIDDIKDIIEGIVERGDYSPPEEFMNLNLAIQMTQSAYLRAKTDNVDAEKLELLRRFISDCMALTKQQAMLQEAVAKAQQLDQMQQQQAQAPLQAQGERPPVSDLMPFTKGI